MEDAGLQRLRTHVLDAGLCTLCGACSGLCPYLRPFQGRVAVLDNCPLTQSRCFQFCPRTGVDLDQLSQETFDVPYQGSPLGEVRGVFMSRGADPQVRQGAQYGGTVSTLVSLALERDLIDVAVLTRSYDGVPKGVAVSTPEQVRLCQGSNYLASPTLEAFNRLPQDVKRVGIAGTPCQLLALTKMRVAPTRERSNVARLALTIGLFCTWALSYDFLKRLAQVASSTHILRTDVPPPPANIFQVYTPEGQIDIPLDEVRPFVPQACTLCHDMTAEFSDISVGSAEGIEGWNTVLVRTQRGAELFDLAVSQGRLEKKKLPQGNYDHLSESAMNKKRRALRNLEMAQNHDGNHYLKVSPSARHRILQT